MGARQLIELSDGERALRLGEIAAYTCAVIWIRYAPGGITLV